MNDYKSKERPKFIFWDCFYQTLRYNFGNFDFFIQYIQWLRWFRLNRSSRELRLVRVEAIGAKFFGSFRLCLSILSKYLISSWWSTWGLSSIRRFTWLLTEFDILLNPVRSARRTAGRIKVSFIFPWDFVAR